MAGDFSMYGPEESGSRLFDLDQMALGRNRALIDEANARTRLLGAQAGSAELTLGNEQRFAELLKGLYGQQVGMPGGADDLSVAAGNDLTAAFGGTPEGGAGPAARPRSPAETFSQLADLAAKSGLATKAEALSKTAAYLRAREAQTNSAMITARLNSIKAIREQARLTGQAFGGVTDQQSFDDANALYEFQTGQPSPYKGVPYSPELIDTINSQAMSAKERADEEEKRLTRQGLTDYRGSRLAQIDEQNRLRRLRMQLAQQREERLAKAGGGKGVASPTSSEIGQARGLIKREFPNLPSEDLRDSAFDLASEAKALRRANPALDASTAIAQAYSAARQRGDFAHVRSGVMGVGAKDAYASGKSSANPLSLPMTEEKGSTRVNTGALKVGHFYISPTGVIGQWTGKGFKVPDASRPLSGDNTRLPVGGAEDDIDKEDASGDEE